MINALVQEGCHHFLLVYFHLECQAKAQGYLYLKFSLFKKMIAGSSSNYDEDCSNNQERDTAIALVSDTSGIRKNVALISDHMVKQ